MPELRTGCRYQVKWVCPRPLGKLFITNVVPGSAPGLDADGENFAGLNYTVYFTSSAGTKGSFDMVTQSWTFNDE